MANVGIAPLDPNSTIGQIRNAIGDGIYVELNPPQEGFGDYQWFSDGEISVCSLLGGDSMLRAVGHAYLKMASILGLKERAVADLDLKLDAKGRAAQYRLLAETCFEQADLADKRDANDIFDGIDFAGFDRGYRGEYDLWPHIYPAQGPLWPNSIPVAYPDYTDGRDAVI